MGQSQLLCIARVLLRRNKIVVLDEATASIDNETDQMLQDSIFRSYFQDCTGRYRIPFVVCSCCFDFFFFFDFKKSSLFGPVSDCVVITIAHRLHTIIDSDRILVLESGVAVEFDTPKSLAERPDSCLNRLIDATDANTAAFLRQSIERTHAQRILQNEAKEII
jgi:ABC-type multidrug transport system ATPase subunit